MYRILSLILLAGLTSTVLAEGAAEAEPINVPPKGFTALFNGKNLEGWQINVDMARRKKLSPEAYEKEVKERTEKFLKHWVVKDGVIEYDGKGQSLQTAKDY